MIRTVTGAMPCKEGGQLVCSSHTSWVTLTGSPSASLSSVAYIVTLRHGVGPLPFLLISQPTDGTHQMPFSASTPSM